MRKAAGMTAVVATGAAKRVAILQGQAGVLVLPLECSVAAIGPRTACQLCTGHFRGTVSLSQVLAFPGFGVVVYEPVAPRWPVLVWVGTSATNVATTGHTCHMRALGQVVALQEERPGELDSKKEPGPCGTLRMAMQHPGDGHAAPWGWCTRSGFPAAVRLLHACGLAFQPAQSHARSPARAWLPAHCFACLLPARTPTPMVPWHAWSRERTRQTDLQKY